MRDRVEAYLEEHPEYLDILDRIVEYEENNPDPDNAWIADKEYDTCWRHKDVSAHPSKLYQLETKGVLDRVIDTNSSTGYALSDRDGTKRLVEQFRAKYVDGRIIEKHDFPETEEELDGLFDDVIGYEKAKWLVKRGMTTEDITNFLFYGPPGSAKTVFLMCINKLEGSEFVSAAEASGAGFLDVMFEKRPRFVTIDELDDMDIDDQKNLSQYTETGILKETKYDKSREMETNAKTFATANSLEPIMDQIEDRFVTLYFEAYDRSEFIEVCEHLLPRKENTPEDEARNIAELVWDKEGEGDVRQAIAIARLSRGDPEKVMDAIDEYSEGETTLLQ